MPELKITLKRSMIGYEKSQGLTAKALGLGKLNSSVIQQDTAPIRGMIKKLAHVLLVESDGVVISSPPERVRVSMRTHKHHATGVTR